MQWIKRLIMNYPRPRGAGNSKLMFIFASCLIGIQANAYFFSVDQLINNSHAKTGITYLQLKKKYFDYYYEHIWKPKHPQYQEDDGWHDFWFECEFSIPESLFVSNFFIHKGNFVTVFKNSSFESTDRISGFLGHCRGLTQHVYIRLENSGLKDALNWNHTNLYIITETQSKLERFAGINLRTADSLKADSILSCASNFLHEHPQAIRDIWYNTDTSISFDKLKESIRNSFDITVFVTDFTADGINDFILKAGRKKYPEQSFTIIFESAGSPPQFNRWSEFKQVIRNIDSYLLLLRTWKHGTGCWGWTVYEGKGDGKLKHIFSEYAYSD